MATQHTRVGREVEEALEEVLTHVRGETPLPCRIVEDPAAEHVRRKGQAQGTVTFPSPKRSAR